MDDISSIAFEGLLKHLMYLHGMLLNFFDVPFTHFVALFLLAALRLLPFIDVFPPAFFDLLPLLFG